MLILQPTKSPVDWMVPGKNQCWYFSLSTISPHHKPTSWLLCVSDPWSCTN